MAKLLPQAGEAAVVLCGAESSWIVRDPVTGEREELPRKHGVRRGMYLRVEPTDEQKALRKAQRAKTNCRRWAKANRLRYMWTPTYAKPCTTWAQLRADVTGFMKFLSKHVYPVYGRVPLLIVAEPHPGGHGWHLHIGSRVFIRKALLVQGWKKHGFIQLTQGKRAGELVTDNKGRASVGNVSRYLAKYVAKGIDAADMPGVELPPAGRHRYWITQGFKPEVLSARFETREDALAWIAGIMPEGPDAVFASRLLKGWEGPPCWWLRFPERAQWPAPMARAAAV